jgi:hypothetical protein
MPRISALRIDDVEDVQPSHSQTSDRRRFVSSGSSSHAEAAPRNVEQHPLELELATLHQLGLDSLRARWRSAFGRSASKHLPPSLLLRLLAYRLQAQCFGDLDPASAKLLERVARDRELRNFPLADRDAVRPGAMLVREWQGKTHQVIALEEGFEWNGTTYQSLSEVARAITGTRWNGPRFFGLRSPAKVRRAKS